MLLGRANPVASPTVTPAVHDPADDGGPTARVASLDGLRALSIAGVLGVHLGLGYVPGGHLGVSVFFVLSGYLITAQLRSEYRRRGGLDLRAFYRRRAARLFPALGVVLLAAGAYALTRWPLSDVLTGVGAAAFYVGNVVAAAGGGEGMAGFSWSWTLSLEEQFYLLWPAVLLFLRFRVAAVLAVTAAVILAGAAFRAWEPLVGATPGIYFAPHTRVGGLLLGAVLALLPARRWVQALPRGLVTSAAVASVAVVCAGFLVADVHSRVTYVIWIPLTELAAAVLVAALVHGATGLERGLALPAVAHVGRISYGIYLWNMPVSHVAHDLLGPGVAGSTLTLVTLAVTIAVAQLSWVLVERPVLRRVRSSTAGRSRGRGDRPVRTG